MQCFDELHTKFCLPLIIFLFQPSTDNSFETETNILPEQKMKADSYKLLTCKGLVIIFQKVPEESFQRNLIYIVSFFAFLLFTNPS